MTTRRTLALAALSALLVAYGAAAEHLWDLPFDADVAVQCLAIFPAFAAVVWLALPLARRSSFVLLAAAAVAVALAFGLALLGVDSAANVARLGTYVLVGFWFLSLFEELWWVAAVSVLIPWLDVWSVAAGPTRYVVEQKPGIFERLSIAFSNPGEAATVNVGPPDVIFFSLFLAAADRFHLRVAWTWIGMTAYLSLTLTLVLELDVGLPALPAVSLGFLLPNADLLWRHLRDARARAREREETPAP